MEKNKTLTYLRYILYRTIFEKDITAKTFADPNCLVKLEREQGEKNFTMILKAMKHGIDNPDSEFNLLLPNLPHSNDDILIYLKNLYHAWTQLKNGKAQNTC